MIGKKEKVTVSKLLMSENKELKKSLKVVQDALEDLRTKNHALDKENGIMGYRLTTAFVPEILKFLASSIGAGFAISLYFSGNVSGSLIVFAVSIFVFGGILFLYRKA
jgi:hypothetical protein